ncbi:MAG TPA: hypothetical protein VGT08_15375 [Terracidiphilus sp.]|nr:hypothetical protein [Terracidiphilus sp.]
MRTPVFALAALLLGASITDSAELQRTNCRGWESLQLRNEFIRLDVTP